MTQFDEHSPSVSPSGILQYGVPASQSALVKHGVPCPSTGETKSSVMVDTAKRNAARLAPLLCSERISPLLCRCFFSSSQGDRSAESTSAFGLHLTRRRSKPFAGDRRAPPWLGSHYLHPFSPLFHATTIAHNAPPGDMHSGSGRNSVRNRSDMFEAVISHSGRCEAAGQRTTRRGDAFWAYRRGVRGGAAQHGPATTLPLPT